MLQLYDLVALPAFKGMKRVKGAIYRAATMFNEGATSLTQIMQKLYTELVLAACVKENRKRIAQAEKKADEKAKRKRKDVDEKKRAN